MLSGTNGTTAPERANVIEASHLSLVLNTSRELVRILDGVDLTVRGGDFVAVVGPSGSGKTMFLNTIAGVEPFTGGSLKVLGDAPRAGRPEIGYAMARDSLLPWRTAVGNVELSLEPLGVPKEERRRRSLDALARVGLADYAGAYRAQLSQGMRQRVALARTLVRNPELLLLDEPFAALDAQTRIVMQERLLQVLQRYEGTVFLVTHDLAEAILLSDRVVVFSRRPARVKHEFAIDLPRPRSAMGLRSTPEFQDLQAAIWADLAEEVSEQ
jgi:NitT/TauT family transport system ATP-binding protein